MRVNYQPKMRLHVDKLYIKPFADSLKSYGGMISMDIGLTVTCLTWHAIANTLQMF